MRARRVLEAGSGTREGRRGKARCDEWFPGHEGHRICDGSGGGGATHRSSAQGTCRGREEGGRSALAPGAHRGPNLVGVEVGEEVERRGLVAGDAPVPRKERSDSTQRREERARRWLGKLQTMLASTLGPSGELGEVGVEVLRGNGSDGVDSSARARCRACMHEEKGQGGRGEEGEASVHMGWSGNSSETTNLSGEPTVGARDEADGRARFVALARN